MIDTDKYEGHSEEPWRLMKDGNYDRYIALEPDDDYYEGETWVGITNGERDLRESDAQLMADAPLLLAEVKRLHHAMVYVSMKIFWNENGIPYEYTQLMEYCRQHCGEPDDMSGELGQMISEFEDEFPYQEELD